MSVLVVSLALLGLLTPYLPLGSGAAPLVAQETFGPNIQGYGFGQNKINYRHFDWHVYHSPHFNIYYYTAEEASLQKVVSYAESDYDDVSRFLNFQIKEPTPLIFFASHSAFEQNNVILDFIPEGIGAFASPIRFRMVLPIDDPDGELIALIRHELTHIFQYHILFNGSMARALSSNLPTWFIEGMASYVGRDETVRDTMYLRDAVVNDIIPPITRTDVSGFFAYRFGHAVFAFIEDRWGHEGFLDFLFEMRNTIGSRVDRAVKRAFKLDAEEFDTEFRRWLRKKYLPSLIATGEPSDFGRIFRVQEDRGTYETSPVASPSGDLVASFSAYRGKVDVVLLDARKRRLIRNLTKPWSSKYQYLIAQELETGRRLGRDLSFSPDGNSIAVFAKRERGRSLLILDALNGGIRRIIDMDEIEQQNAPSFSPDGKKVAFSGTKDGKFDIFVLDLDSTTISRLTDDTVFDGAPSFSPDGKSIVLVSVVGASSHAKLFRIDLDKPGVRIPLTSGDTNENDPIYSPDGKRVYFTSDRGGRENVYSIELGSGELRQYTNVVSGAFMPTPLKQLEGEERLVYTGYWRTVFDLYETGTTEPFAKYAYSGPAAAGGVVVDMSVPASTAAAAGAAGVATSTAAAANAAAASTSAANAAAANAATVAAGGTPGASTAPPSAAAAASPATGTATPAPGTTAASGTPSVAAPASATATTAAEAAAASTTAGGPAAPSQGMPDLAPFEPDIQVTIDRANMSPYRGYKFFLEDASAYAGIDTQNTYTGRILLTFSDQLGDHRIIADFGAIETYSDFNLIYADLANRLQWSVRAFDTREFYIGYNLNSSLALERGPQVFEETGAVGNLTLPISFYHRIELGVGYMIRRINYTEYVNLPNGAVAPVITPSDDNFPVVTAAIVGDASLDAGYGPFAGERYRIDALYGPAVGGGGGGTLYSNVMIDARKYFQLTQRSNFAFRVWGGLADGSRPTPFFIGGLDTIRGVDFRSLIGDRAFFGNAEFRFPLIDILNTPVLGFRGIRGNLFFDTGGAWFHDLQTFQFYSAREHALVDGIASYGGGITINLLGLDLNLDLAKVTTFKTTQAGLATDFWIGTRF